MTYSQFMCDLTLLIPVFWSFSETEIPTLYCSDTEVLKDAKVLETSGIQGLIL